MNILRAILLTKLAEILDLPPSTEVTNHFPFSTNQQLWKYKHKDGILALKNGESIYSFSFPEKLYPETEEENHSFNIKRLNDDTYRTMDTSERTAQVHRSHPGQLYVTLHEGSRNPTYTLKHEKEDTWKASLKKKLNKQLKDFIPVQEHLGDNPPQFGEYSRSVTKSAYTIEEKLARLKARRDPNYDHKEDRLKVYTKQANMYGAGVNAMNAFTNLPPAVVGGGAMGASYLLNKSRKETDPFDEKHPLVSKLMDYGIPAATIMAMYYGGKGLFTPGAGAMYNPV